MLKKAKKCSYCGRKYDLKREKCPAFEKTCTNCFKQNHFQAVCKLKKKNFETVEENDTNV